MKNSFASSQSQKWTQDVLDFVENSEKNHLDSAVRHKSLALGVHKGGSTMLHNFIQQYAKLWNQQSSICAKINVLDIPNLLFTELGIPASDFDEETIIPDIILSRGYQSCFLVGEKYLCLLYPIKIFFPRYLLFAWSETQGIALYLLTSVF